MIQQSVSQDLEKTESKISCGLGERGSQFKESKIYSEEKVKSLQIIVLEKITRRQKKFMPDNLKEKKIFKKNRKQKKKKMWQP